MQSTIVAIIFLGHPNDKYAYTRVKEYIAVALYYSSPFSLALISQAEKYRKLRVLKFCLTA